MPHSLLTMQRKGLLTSSNQNQRAQLLWKQIRAGSAGALEELFYVYYPILNNYGHKLCNQREVVKDCIQDTFAIIWEKRDTLSRPDSVKGYLLVTLRRHLLKNIKKQARQRQARQQYALETPSEAFSAEDLVVFSEIEESSARFLKKAFNSIPVRMREALYLKTYQELKYKEIGEVMHVSPQVARNYVSQGYQRLRLLAAEIGADPSEDP